MAAMFHSDEKVMGARHAWAITALPGPSSNVPQAAPDPRSTSVIRLACTAARDLQHAHGEQVKVSAGWLELAGFSHSACSWQLCHTLPGTIQHLPAGLLEVGSACLTPLSISSIRQNRPSSPPVASAFSELDSTNKLQGLSCNGLWLLQVSDNL